MIGDNYLSHYYTFHTHPNERGGSIGLSGTDLGNLNNIKNFASGGPADGYPVFGGAFDGQTQKFFGAIDGVKYDVSFADLRKELGCK